MRGAGLWGTAAQDLTFSAESARAAVGFSLFALGLLGQAVPQEQEQAALREADQHPLDGLCGIPSLTP